MPSKSRKGIGGRPTKKTPELVNKLKAAFEIDATVEEACAFAGISKETFYKRYRKDKKFVDEIDAAKLTPFLRAKRTYMRGVDSERRAADKFLEKRHKDYRPKSQTELTGKDGKDLFPDDLRELSTEELLALLKAK